jgi:putative oxidoreductase
MGIGLALLRLATGLILATHGAQKLFGWFGGPGLDGTGQFFETIGFLPGRRHALMAGLAETGGGLLLALGLFTPIGAALICSVMVVAVTVHMKNGFFAQNGGYEYAIVLGIAALSVAFTGPGSFTRCDVRKSPQWHTLRYCGIICWRTWCGIFAHSATPDISAAN